MSRADRARRERAAEERDRLAHERPNEPPELMNRDPNLWESFCPGNRTQRHGWPEAKITNIVNGAEVHRWRCGSCGRWLVVSKERATARP